MRLGTEGRKDAREEVRRGEKIKRGGGEEGGGRGREENKNVFGANDS